MNEFLEKEEAILRMLKTVFDPEIPVNIYDLGLIYGIELKDDGVCEITMTLTAPSCPAGDFIVEDVRQKVGSIEGIKDVNVTIVFEPEWNKDMMSEEAKLELGFLWFVIFDLRFMIYFLSDAHLGSLAIEKGWAHQKKLIDMLEEMSKDAASIYMLGDMFDFWM